MRTAPRVRALAWILAFEFMMVNWGCWQAATACNPRVVASCEP